MKTEVGASKERQTGRWIVRATLVVAAITLCVRLFSLRPLPDQAAVNVTLLKAVMTPASRSSNQESSTDISSLKRPVSGFQARALAQLAAVVDDSAAVETWLAEGLTDQPSFELTQFELCLLYWNAGRRDVALQACQGTRASAKYWLNQGLNQLGLGNQDEALAYFQMAGYTDSSNAEAWRQLGLGLFAGGYYDKAVIALERVFALESKPPADVYESLGAAYLKLNNVAMARDIFNRGLSVYPDDRVLYLGISDTYRLENDFAAADSWYSRLLQRWPYDAHAWGLRGQLAEQDGRMEDAVTYYEEAIATQPDGLGYWLNLALAAQATGDIPQATEAYLRVLEFRPEDTSTLLQVGRFLVETDQIDEARELFERVLVLQPDNDEAAALLAGLVNPPTRP